MYSARANIELLVGVESEVAVFVYRFAEQVKITQPLTLNGVQTDNDASVVITAPARQLATFMANPLTFVAAQLEVIQSGGAVNISGGAVDGTSLAIPGVTFGTNILYESSPGAVNHVVLKCPIATSAIDGTIHSGIIVMDDYSVSPAVTIKNSSVISTLASVNAIGVNEFAISTSLTVANNFISGPQFAGVYISGSADSVT